MWIGLTDDKVIDVEHLGELLHGQVLFHTTITEFGPLSTFIPHRTIGILDHEPIGFKDAWK